MKKQRKLLFLVLLTFVHLGFPSFPENNQRLGLPKYNLAIATLYDGEAEHFEEWIEYHCMLGCEHFYIYNIGQQKSLKRFQNYINEGLVTVIPWIDFKFLKEDNCLTDSVWKSAVLLPIYDHAVHFFARNAANWFCCLEINEYLVPNYITLETLLLENDKKPSILLEVQNFSVSTHPFFGKRMLIETLQKAPPLTRNPKDLIPLFRPENFTTYSEVCRVSLLNDQDDIVDSLKGLANRYLLSSASFFSKNFKENACKNAGFPYSELFFEEGLEERNLVSVENPILRFVTLLLDRLQVRKMQESRTKVLSSESE